MYKKIATLSILMVSLCVVFISNGEGKTDVTRAQHQQAVQDLLPSIAKSKRVKAPVAGLKNEEAPIPPQCYTKTESVHNPCYVCHQNYPDSHLRNNRRLDGSNQGIYTFSDEGESNAWQNLFVDRQAWIAQVSDQQITQYIEQDNYSALAKRLQNKQWQGFVPDLKNYQNASQAFDKKGIAKDGSAWVAFNYKPFPSTFWPTNGATDDVLIRLPKAFRELNGKFNEDVYLINLSLVEMTIKALDNIDIFMADEIKLKTDLDQDGKLTSQVEQLLTRKTFIGDAKQIKIPQQQYPQGTEIMHSVRYIGADDNGDISVSKRMKELRYMTKTKVMNEAAIDTSYRRERKEKLDEQLPHFNFVKDRGFNNKFGWLIQGFIEDYNGELRPQSYEETMYCMGCHSSIGTTIDQTFSFPRKVTGKAGWGYINLKGMKDAPAKGQQQGEILQYLQANGGGNEFRENPEMQQKWFNEQGNVDIEKVKKADVYSLLTPSKQRAMQLNKAYTQIVREQSYINGRDVTIVPAVNVHKKIDESVAPLKPEKRIEAWDIRLDW